MTLLLLEPFSGMAIVAPERVLISLMVAPCFPMSLPMLLTLIFSITKFSSSLLSSTTGFSAFGFVFTFSHPSSSFLSPLKEVANIPVAPFFAVPAMLSTLFLDLVAFTSTGAAASAAGALFFFLEYFLEDFLEDDFLAG